MEVEVFLWGLRLGVGGGEISEWRRCGNHQQREGLGSRGCEALLFAIFDMECMNTTDGIQQFGILCSVISGVD